jgi:hypothetical protein
MFNIFSVWHSICKNKHKRKRKEEKRKTHHIRLSDTLSASARFYVLKIMPWGYSAKHCRVLADAFLSIL